MKLTERVTRLFGKYPKRTGIISGIALGAALSPVVFPEVDSISDFFLESTKLGMCSGIIGYLQYKFSQGFQLIYREGLNPPAFGKPYSESVSSITSKLQKGHVKDAAVEIGKLPVTHPSIGGLTFTLGLWGCALAAKYPDPIMFPSESPGTALLLSGITTATGALVSSSVFPILQRIKHQKNKDLIIGTLFNAFGKPDSTITYFKDKEVDSSSNTPLVQAHLKKGNIEEAILLSKNWIYDSQPASTNFENACSIIDLLTWANCNRVDLSQKKEPFALDDFIYAQYLSRKGYAQKAKEKIWRGLKTKYPLTGIESIEKFILGSYFFESLGFSEESNTTMKQVIRLLTQNKEVNFDKIDDYNVFHFEGQRLLSSALIFKQGNTKQLKIESQLSHDLISILNETPYESVEPIGIFDLDHHTFLVHKHAQGKRLSDYLENEEDFATISLTVQNLAYINAKMQPYSLRKEEQTLNKLASRLKKIEGSIATSIWDNIQFIFKNQEEIPIVFNKDGHTDNYFVTPERTIINLDVQDKGVVSLDEEASRIYALGKSYAHTPQNYDWIGESIQRDYITTFANNQRSKPIPKKLDLQIKKMILGTSLSHYLFHLDHPTKVKRGVDSIKNALFIMDGLQDRDIPHLKENELYCIDQLRKEYNKLIA